MSKKEINKEYRCSNQECKKMFDKPKEIHYYACPYCMTRVEEKENNACQYYFGYLSKKEANNPIPQECIECKKVLECMFNKQYHYQTTVEEIKKWY